MTNNNKKNILNNKIYDGNKNTTGNGLTNEAIENPADRVKQKNDKNLINRGDNESKFQD
jgi:hypothetical protein